jgi:hypothetical protein
MRRVGQTRRRDLNERAICQALHRIGVQTFAISIPGLGDLLCWRADTGWQVLEIKTLRGRLTKAQRAVHTAVPIRIVRSIDEALALYGTAPVRAAFVRAAHGPC